jgi:Tol biopolymer transport system component
MPSRSGRKSERVTVDELTPGEYRLEIALWEANEPAWPPPTSAPKKLKDMDMTLGNFPEWSRLPMPVVFGVLALVGILGSIESAAADDPLAPWRTGVSVRPVQQVADRHTIHSYFNTCPESPDGRKVLFYASTTPNGHEGELRILERATGQERGIARNVTVEDAHRVACQQWLSNGKRVAFHDVRNDQWLVAVIDMETGQERVVARDRQLGWGQPTGNVVPVYGCHWSAEGHCDLDLVNVETGQTRTVVTAASVRQAYPESLARQFGDRKVSIFFPILSPDENRVFFKLATPGGGDFRSKSASIRWGLVCRDLVGSRFLFIHAKWGHPAWHPDSRTILQTGNIVIDSDSGSVHRIPGLPRFPGSHPSVSPDGRLFVTDTTLEDFGGSKGEWGIVVGRMDGGEFAIIHRFDQSRGARSWRRSHPHPVFSADGRRIYFNTNSTQWTQLHVAEAERDDGTRRGRPRA